MLGNFLTTSLIDDSSDLSDKNEGFEFESPHAYVKKSKEFQDVDNTLFAHRKPF